MRNLLIILGAILVLAGVAAAGTYAGVGSSGDRATISQAPLQKAKPRHVRHEDRRASRRAHRLLQQAAEARGRANEPNEDVRGREAEPNDDSAGRAAEPNEDVSGQNSGPGSDDSSSGSGSGHGGGSDD